MLAGGYYYAPQGFVSAASTIPTRLTLAAFWLSGSVSFDLIGVTVTSAPSPYVLRLGVYSDSGNCYPGALALDAGSLTGSTTGVKSIVTSWQPPCEGIYWAACIDRGGSPTILQIGGAGNDDCGTLLPFTSQLPGKGNVTSAGWQTYFASLVGGTALPADALTAGSGLSIELAAARVFLRTA